MITLASLARALGGVVAGGQVVAPGPGHSRRDRSLAVRPDGKGGLLIHSFAGDDWRECLAHVQAALGGRAVVHADRETRADMAERTRMARDIWARALPIEGSPADTYLRGRGIDVPLPPTLRALADCWHPYERVSRPAMIAAVETVGRPGLTGIHRTYLRAYPGQRSPEPRKMMMGACADGAVRLSHGAGPLVAAEGIESGLSYWQLHADEAPTVWAALSTSGLMRLILPPAPGHLIVAPDGDAAGWRAAEALSLRARKLGWRVDLRPAPRGRDWNDLV